MICIEINFIMNLSLKVSEWKKMGMETLEDNLKLIYDQMIVYQKQTDYVNAETYREIHQNCHNYIQQRKYEQMNNRHQTQINDNNDNRRKELLEFLKNSEQRLNQFNEDNNLMKKELQQKYKNQRDLLRLSMEDELSTKVKQSNQLLNLRKMEAHAANQKNFVEAQSIKEKVNKFYKDEKSKWMEARENKIQSAIKSMTKKQDAEMEGINRRIKLALEDLEKDRVMGQLHINQRYDVILKQLKANHEREMLGLFGELRNLGGSSPKKSKKEVAA